MTRGRWVLALVSVVVVIAAIAVTVALWPELPERTLPVPPLQR